MGTIQTQAFGVLEDGRSVELVRLTQPGGFELRVITLGAALQALFVPGADGELADVVLGYDEPEPYRARRQFFGATIGRFSNRIAEGCFTLDGERFQVSVNQGKNTLHGGAEGFDQKLWTVEETGTEPHPFLRLSLVSQDGDQGFPGTVCAHVTYALTGPGEVSITHAATTDRPTVIGMTHHSYFNLAGVERLGSALDHRLEVAAQRFLPINDALIPAGAPQAVAGTPFDFTAPKVINRDLRVNHPQLLVAKGYDHCFCLDDEPAAPLRRVARLDDARSGRAMELWSDQPGLQVYSGNMLTGETAGKYNQIMRPGDAICLEPQAWPDAPNRPDFPPARLEAGEEYRHHAIYRFSAGKPC